jgi:hypothetical protein
MQQHTLAAFAWCSACSASGVDAGAHGRRVAQEQATPPSSRACARRVDSYRAVARSLSASTVRAGFERLDVRGVCRGARPLRAAVFPVRALARWSTCWGVVVGELLCLMIGCCVLCWGVCSRELDKSFQTEDSFVFNDTLTLLTK